MLPASPADRTAAGGLWFDASGARSVCERDACRTVAPAPSNRRGARMVRAVTPPIAARRSSGAVGEGKNGAAARCRLDHLAAPRIVELPGGVARGMVATRDAAVQCAYHISDHRALSLKNQSARLQQFRELGLRVSELGF